MTSNEIQDLVADAGGFRFLWEAMEHMPEDQARVMELVCLDGLSLQDTAEELDVSRKTVSTLARRACVSLGLSKDYGAINRFT